MVHTAHVIGFKCHVNDLSKHHAFETPSILEFLYYDEKIFEIPLKNYTIFRCFDDVYICVKLVHLSIDDNINKIHKCARIDTENYTSKVEKLRDFLTTLRIWSVEEIHKNTNEYYVLEQ